MSLILFITFVIYTLECYFIFSKISLIYIDILYRHIFVYFIQKRNDPAKHIIVGLKGHNTQNRIDGPYGPFPHIICHMCLDVILVLVVLL